MSAFERVIKRFPDQKDAILHLSEENAGFRQLCEDYEQAAAQLDAYCETSGKASTRCDTYREMVGSLGDDIENALRQFHDRDDTKGK